MKPKRYQKTLNIADLINKSDVAQIMKKGLFINELNQKLHKLFPAQFQGLYRLSNFSANSLHIEVANASVRQALLFRQVDLLTLVQQQHPEITQLQFKINPELGK
ncbi:hypothetical protein A4G18_06470 [Pasteurellaceae bacterium Pebbles2]|nr:hypothetical protein [Pasteurellaceae bacterium Pebbles2]